jgi:hypothetical protein
MSTIDDSWESVSGMCMQLLNIMMHQQNSVLNTICSMLVVLQWRIYYAWQEIMSFYSVRNRKIVCILNTSWLISLNYTFIGSLGISTSEVFQVHILVQWGLCSETFFTLRHKSFLYFISILINYNINMKITSDTCTKNRYCLSLTIKNSCMKIWTFFSFYWILVEYRRRDWPKTAEMVPLSKSDYVY